MGCRSIHWQQVPHESAPCAVRVTVAFDGGSVLGEYYHMGPPIRPDIDLENYCICRALRRAFRYLNDPTVENFIRGLL